MTGIFPLRQWGVFGVCAALAAAPAVGATPLRWMGAGSDGRWSDLANWSPAQLPETGSELLIGGGASFATSTIDYSVALSALTFETDAQLFGIQVAGSGSTVLSFTGMGIHNLTGSGGPIRQALRANAGATGGTIAFTGSSGVNAGASSDARAVDLTAAGASVAGDAGGRILFQDTSSVGTQTFDSLRSEGASAAGAGGGDLKFRDSASSGAYSTITVTGGSTLGAVGGQASFADLSRVGGLLNLMAGSSGGEGARAIFSGGAVGSSSLGIASRGGESSGDGSEAVATFRDDARLEGSAQNFAAQAIGARGGRLEFADRASWDSTGLDPSLGTLIILNSGSRIAGAEAGRVVFRDDSFARGTQLQIINDVAESAAAGTSGGVTEFLGRSHAGYVRIENRGAGSAAAGTLGGQTYFRNSANAGNANIVNRSGQGAIAAPGGLLEFRDDASGGSSVVNNEGGTAAGDGGKTRFFDRSSAGQALIQNSGGAADGAYGGTLEFWGAGTNAGAGAIINGSTAFNAVGGSTFFFDGASAGSAYLINEHGKSGGRLRFLDNSTAGSARVDNRGASIAGGSDSAGQTYFQDTATAGNASITNFGGLAASSFGGLTAFFHDASAGSASMVNAGSAVNTGIGGSTLFYNRASAGNASIAVTGGTVAGGGGGNVYFRDQSSAGSAQIAIDSLVVGAGMGLVEFVGNASAGNAQIEIGLRGIGAPDGGRLNFRSTSTAAGSSITVGSPDGGFALLRSVVEFFDQATAGDARISNVGAPSGPGATAFRDNATAGRAVIRNGPGVLSGTSFFQDASTAGTSVITNLGASVSGSNGGRTLFFQDATAGSATITSAGGGVAGSIGSGDATFRVRSTAGSASITAQGGAVAGASGARTQFEDLASAGASTLTAEGGRVDGAAGGAIWLFGQASGGTASVALRAGSAGGQAGLLDISGLTTAGTGIGSLEGEGLVYLGSKNLRVGANNRSTTFAGTIADGGGVAGAGGSLTVVSSASLTLTGASTYTGGTRIGDGVNAGSGKLVAANSAGSATGSGPVVIERGGTLGGSGFIAGPVTLRAGGLLAPGDPVTLTLQDSLTWDGGGVIRLVLGADSAHSDQLVLGSLVRGAAGRYVIDFVDGGVTYGASYSLLHFDSLEGFSAADFSFTGLGGAFDLTNGTLGITISAVPEPAQAMLLLAGLALLAARRDRRARV